MSVQFWLRSYLNLGFLYCYKLYLDFDVKLKPFENYFYFSTNIRYNYILRRRKLILAKKMQGILIKLAWYQLILQYPSRVNSSTLVKFFTFLQIIFYNFFTKRFSFSQIYNNLHQTPLYIHNTEVSLNENYKASLDFSFFLTDNLAIDMDPEIAMNTDFVFTFNFNEFFSYVTENVSEELFFYLNLGFQIGSDKELYHSHNNFYFSFEEFDILIAKFNSKSTIFNRFFLFFFNRKFINFILNKFYNSYFGHLMARHINVVFRALFTLPNISYLKQEFEGLLIKKKIKPKMKALRLEAGEFSRSLDKIKEVVKALKVKKKEEDKNRYNVKIHSSIKKRERNKK